MINILFYKMFISAKYGGVCQGSAFTLLVSTDLIYRRFASYKSMCLIKPCNVQISMLLDNIILILANSSSFIFNFHPFEHQSATTC
jgi:hypothetical protein